jgi:hypothetical protein
MLGLGKQHERERIKIDRETFSLDRQNGTLTRVDDPTKIFNIKDLPVNEKLGGIPVLWDKLTGMPYAGYMPRQGFPLNTELLVLPRHIIDKKPPITPRRFRR